MSEPEKSSPDGASRWRPASETDAPARSRRPLLIGLGALLALLLVVGLVAALVSRSGPSGVPTGEMTTTAPPLELPLKVNELQRDPNAQQSDSPAADSGQEAVTGIYNVNGRATLVVLAARPVAKPQDLLDQIDARAVRRVGDAWCGRQSAQDIDMCVVMKGNTGVLGGGLAKQPLDQIVAQTQAVADAMAG